MRFLQESNVGQTMAEKPTMEKAGRVCKARDGAVRLKVRIEDDFDHGEQPTGLERSEDFGESGCAVGNFTENGDQNGSIKVLRGKDTIAEGRGDELDVGETGSLGLGFCPGKHTRLDVQRDDTAGRAHTTRQGNGKAPRATASVQNRHAG